MMNTTLKRISLALIFLAIPRLAQSDEAKDCKHMVDAQAQMQKSVKLLTNPGGHSEKVDVRSEYAALNIAGIKLRVLASRTRCGMSVARVNPENVTVKYTSPLSISREEKFVMSKSREILSWQQINKKGQSNLYNFGPSGEVVSTFADEEL